MQVLQLLQPLLNRNCRATIGACATLSPSFWSIAVELLL